MHLSTLERAYNAPSNITTLRNAQNDTIKIETLRTIKNDLVGHEIRKVKYIENGLISIIEEILSNSKDEILYNQAANIISILSHEGPAFVHSILESEIIEEFLSILKSIESSKLSLSILKCLNALADNLPPSTPGQWIKDKRLSTLLYSRNYVLTFRTILFNSNSTTISQQCCDLIIRLLCKTCTKEWEKRALIEVDILEILSTRLATFIISEGLIISNFDSLDSNLLNSIEDIHLSPILEAINILIEGSKDRAYKFLTNETISKVLPISKDDFSPSDIRQTPWGGSYLSGTAVPRSNHNPFEQLLPTIPITEKENESNFPPLGSIGTISKRRSSFHPISEKSTKFSEPIEDIEESSIIPWLLYIAREFYGRRRLLSIKLLVTLYKLQLIRKSRSQTFTALLIPILVRMLDEKSISNCIDLDYTKLVPSILANLIIDNSEMQKVAVDAKAIPKLSIALKSTFEITSGKKLTTWKPFKDVEKSNNDKLGFDGPTIQMRQNMLYREGILQALASIAPFNDDYRKEICDQGILNQIMSSLEPFCNDDITLSTGNSSSTILAACGTVRALTRSVTALRTKLVDADVAKPIIKLLNHRDPEVRIAATKVLANLAMEFSPMKETVGDMIVVKKLCEQAHSANAKLRLESLWALKLLVVNSSKKLKKDIIDELGPNWIKLLIKTDPWDIPENEIIGLIEKNYAPRIYTEDVIMGENEDANIHIESDDYDFNKHTTEDDLAIQEQLLDLIRNLFCGDNASELIDYLLTDIGKDDFFKILLDRLKPKLLPGATRKDNQSNAAPTEIIIKVLYVIVHIAASHYSWRNVIVNQYGLMKQILQLCQNIDREIRIPCCWIVINLTYEDDSNDRNACKTRAIELQKLGFLLQLKKLENDIDLDVRERAKTAVHLMSQLVIS